MQSDVIWHLWTYFAVNQTKWKIFSDCSKLSQTINLDVINLNHVFPLLRRLTVDRADLVAHGEADQVIICVKHHKDLVDAQLLCGRGPPGGLLMGAALKGDGLTPLVAPGLDDALG